MLHAFGWLALAVIGVHLLFMLWGSVQAARAAGRSIWLFGRAKGRDRLAAIGFRAAFALASVGPLLWLAVPALHKFDPLWTEGRWPPLGFAGATLAAVGAMLALAARTGTGASWRARAKKGGRRVRAWGGPLGLMRDPALLGQFLLLAGVALAILSLPTLAGALLFIWSARMQIRSEKAALAAADGVAHDAFRRDVPRGMGWAGRVRP